MKSLFSIITCLCLTVAASAASTWNAAEALANKRVVIPLAHDVKVQYHDYAVLVTKGEQEFVADTWLDEEGRVAWQVTDPDSSMVGLSGTIDVLPNGVVLADTIADFVGERRAVTRQLVLHGIVLDKKTCDCQDHQSLNCTVAKCDDGKACDPNALTIKCKWFTPLPAPSLRPPASAAD